MYEAVVVCSLKHALRGVAFGGLCFVKCGLQCQQTLVEQKLRSLARGQFRVGYVHCVLHFAHCVGRIVARSCGHPCLRLGHKGLQGGRVAGRTVAIFLVYVGGQGGERLHFGVADGLSVYAEVGHESVSQEVVVGKRRASNVAAGGRLGENLAEDGHGGILPHEFPVDKEFAGGAALAVNHAHPPSLGRRGANLHAAFIVIAAG